MEFELLRVLCGQVWTVFTIILQSTSWVPEQSDDYLSTSESTLKNIGKPMVYIQLELLENHNQTRDNTLCLYTMRYTVFHDAVLIPALPLYIYLLTPNVYVELSLMIVSWLSW